MSKSVAGFTPPQVRIVEGLIRHFQDRPDASAVVGMTASGAAADQAVQLVTTPAHPLLIIGVAAAMLDEMAREMRTSTDPLLFRLGPEVDAVVVQLGQLVITTRDRVDGEVVQ